jgi:hypothetical protein
MSVWVRSHRRGSPRRLRSDGFREAARYMLRLRLLDRIGAADKAGSVEEALELRRELVLLALKAEPDHPDLRARLRAVASAGDAATLDRLFAEYDVDRRKGLP